MKINASRIKVVYILDEHLLLVLVCSELDSFLKMIRYSSQNRRVVSINDFKLLALVLVCLRAFIH